MKDWSNEEEELLASLYSEGLSNLEISEAFPLRTYASVNSKLKKLRVSRVIEARMYEKPDVPSVIPLTTEELKFDLRRYAIPLKKKLRATNKLFGQPIVHIGMSYVTIQSDKYRETYSYLDLKMMGVRCS